MFFELKSQIPLSMGLGGKVIKNEQKNKKKLVGLARWSPNAPILETQTQIYHLLHIFNKSLYIIYCIHSTIEYKIDIYNNQNYIKHT